MRFKRRDCSGGVLDGLLVPFIRLPRALRGCHPAHVEDCNRLRSRAGDQAHEVRGELPICTIVGSQEEALHIGHKASFVEFFALKAESFSSPSGIRASAQRSIDGIAKVVMTAIATIIVKRFWLNTPMERP